MNKRYFESDIFGRFSILLSDDLDRITWKCRLAHLLSRRAVTNNVTEEEA